MNYRAGLRRMSMVVKVNLAYRWNAIVAQAVPLASALFMITLLRATRMDNQMPRLPAYYCVISGTTGAMLPAIWPDVFSEIRTGRVVHALVRPFSYIDDLIWGGIGSALWKLTCGLIAAVLVFLLARPTLSAQEVIVFIVLAMPAILLSTLLSTLFSLSAFWILDDLGPSFFVWYLAMFSSGAILPLSVMPRWAQRVFSALPFRYLIDFPATASLGMVSPRAVFYGLATQFAWIAATLVSIHVVWRQAIRRVTLGGF